LDRTQLGQTQRGALEAIHPDVRFPGREAIKAKSVVEQALGKPHARDRPGNAEAITERYELGNRHETRDRGKLPPSSRGTSPSGEITPYDTMRAMIDIDRDRLRELIKERGTTARALSRAVGSNDTLVRDILSGRSKNARGDTIAKLSDELGVEIGELLARPNGKARPPEQLAELPLLGPVQAGAWLAIDETSQEEPRAMAVALDRRYPHARQWLREVRGDSMNARNIFPGDVAHIVELIGSGISLNSGMIVEVLRSRDDGSLREITLKEVEVAEDGKMVLWPRSTNPRWKEPIRLDDDNGTDFAVEVTGLLIAKITRF